MHPNRLKSVSFTNLWTETAIGALGWRISGTLLDFVREVFGSAGGGITGSLEKQTPLSEGMTFHLYRLWYLEKPEQVKQKEQKLAV